MTDRDHDLSLTRQAELLGISRGSLYHEPRPSSEDDLRLMRRIDELHMDYPFAGSRMMKGLLRQEGFTAGECHELSVSGSAHAGFRYGHALKRSSNMIAN